MHYVAVSENIVTIHCFAHMVYFSKNSSTISEGLDLALDGISLHFFDMLRTLFNKKTTQQSERDGWTRSLRPCSAQISLAWPEQDPSLRVIYDTVEGTGGGLGHSCRLTRRRKDILAWTRLTDLRLRGDTPSY